MDIFRLLHNTTLLLTCWNLSEALSWNTVSSLNGSSSRHATYMPILSRSFVWFFQLKLKLYFKQGSPPLPQVQYGFHIFAKIANNPTKKKYLHKYGYWPGKAGNRPLKNTSETSVSLAMLLNISSLLGRHEQVKSPVHCSTKSCITHSVHTIIRPLWIT